MTKPDTSTGELIPIPANSAKVKRVIDEYFQQWKKQLYKDAPAMIYYLKKEFEQEFNEQLRTNLHKVYRLVINKNSAEAIKKMNNKLDTYDINYQKLHRENITLKSENEELRINNNYLVTQKLDLRKNLHERKDELESLKKKVWEEWQTESKKDKVDWNLLQDRFIRYGILLHRISELRKLCAELTKCEECGKSVQ